jgi:catechol 2,3-dioxygenase-like lactoylglutathione lyase family enzyme
MTTFFTGMHAVAVPVSDQERTKALFERLGLQTRLDAELQPGFRWVELAVAGTPTAVALARSGSELPGGVVHRLRREPVLRLRGLTSQSRIPAADGALRVRNSDRRFDTGDPDRDFEQRATTTRRWSALKVVARRAKWSAREVPVWAAVAGDPGQGSGKSGQTGLPIRAVASPPIALE